MDLLLIPVTSVTLASVKSDRTAAGKVYLMNNGSTSHILKFVIRLRHPLYNLRIHTAHTIQDSVSVVQRM
jgi:hypothetical protein